MLVTQIRFWFLPSIATYSSVYGYALHFHALVAMVFELDSSFSAKFVLNTVLAPFLGLPPNPQAAAEAEKLLSKSLSKIESFWLKGSGRFLLGGNQPSIADLSLVCEIMQLEVYLSNLPTKIAQLMLSDCHCLEILMIKFFGSRCWMKRIA